MRFLQLPYFASEGFLPGYNFPRLPISAYIPGRRTKKRDEFLSRPRFLAISKFGPRSTVYHEGSRYIISRVILPVSEDHVHGNVNAGGVKLCDTCGDLHPMTADAGADLCERCRALLGNPLSLFSKCRTFCSTARKISSDEEERVRLGNELQTAVRFPEHTGRPSFRTPPLRSMASLVQGPMVRRRRSEDQYWAGPDDRRKAFGFVLDTNAATGRKTR